MPPPTAQNQPLLLGEETEQTVEHASVRALRLSVQSLPPQRAAVAAKARVGRVWSANQGGAPELAGFVGRVRSTLRELTVADCLTTTNEVSDGSFGDGP